MRPLNKKMWIKDAPLELQKLLEKKATQLGLLHASFFTKYKTTDSVYLRRDVTPNSTGRSFFDVHNFEEITINDFLAL